MNTFIIDGKKVGGPGTTGLRVLGDGTVILDNHPIEKEPIEDTTVPAADKPLHITIIVQAPIAQIKIEGCKTVTIQGNTGEIHSKLAAVHVEGSVEGSVHTNFGNVSCGPVQGSISANGNVNVSASAKHSP